MASSNLPLKSFYFLRHGETARNVQGLGQGTSDIPLNKNGFSQATEAARVFTFHKAQIGKIVSSPLQRALVTAETVAKALEKPVHILENLQEAFLGDNEGALMPTIEVLLEQWKREGSVAKSENWLALQKRVLHTMTTILVDTKIAPLIVSHGIFYVVLNEMMGFPLFFPGNAQPIHYLPAVRHGKTQWIRRIFALSNRT